MARAFVVIGKSSALVADGRNRLVELDEALRRNGVVSGVRRGFPEDGIERILSEDMFDIGQEQLLMLLLVMETQRDDRLDLGEQGLIGFVDQLPDALIDRFAKPVR